VRPNDLPGATAPRRRLLWLWLAVAALAAITCCATTAGALRHGSASGWQPEKIAERYFGLLVSGDLDGAYAMLCTDTFVKMERDAYADFVYEHGHFDTAKVTAGKRVPSPDGNEAWVHVRLSDHGQPVDVFDVRVAEENGVGTVCDGVTGRTGWIRVSTS